VKSKPLVKSTYKAKQSSLGQKLAANLLQASRTLETSTSDVLSRLDTNCTVLVLEHEVLVMDHSSLDLILGKSIEIFHYV